MKFVSWQIIDKEYICGLAYLAHIFGHMNKFSSEIQWPNVTIMDVTERLQAFQKASSVEKT